MVRSVIQSQKEGVSINTFHSEYRSLCGEYIPLAKLGYSKLEDFLRSIPSVVCLKYCGNELKCFAVASKDTFHIAELVAKQKSSKKSGRSQVVNCKMRFKPYNPYMFHVRPTPSLRQPRPGFSSGRSAPGDYRQLDPKLRAMTPLDRRLPESQLPVKEKTVPDRKEKLLENTKKHGEVTSFQAFRPTPPSNEYDVALEQSRITQLLKKYSSGVWMSKVADIYRTMFNQRLVSQVLRDIGKWTHICVIENHSTINRTDQLIYPPLLPVPLSSSPPVLPVNVGTTTFPPKKCPSPPEQKCPSHVDAAPPKSRVPSKSILAKPTFIFPPQPAVGVVSKDVSASVTFPNPANSPALAHKMPQSVHQEYEENNNLPVSFINSKNKAWPFSPTWTSIGSNNISPLSKVASSPHPNPSQPSVVVPDNVRRKIEDLLSKYSMGLWAHALPKLFMDAYKTQFPDYILDNLSLLLHFCCVEYTSTHDKRKAILYKLIDTGKNSIQRNRGGLLPSGLEVIAPIVPLTLDLPSEQFPSVLVTEAKSSNAVTIRYVGEKYSDAQEAMEETMASFYGRSSPTNTLSNLSVGQLVAVRGGEEGEELARAQIMEIISSSKVKVYYMDYGFSLETSTSNLLRLHQDFASLPFQATNVRLAGLEAFSSDPLLLSSLEKMAVDKILLMETLEHSEQDKTPLVVLYDTSQDVDININSVCLKTLQDGAMNNPLQVGVTYPDVCVTHVCADGVVYCQLPSQGMTKLSRLLKEAEAFFTSQMTSECLVSKPFPGKFCLARYRGKWARVEIISLHSNRVIKIFFPDVGVPATIEVTDLREIPTLLLKDLTLIPPQAVKCRLADLTVPEGDWSPGAVLRVKEAAQSSKDCKMKVVKIDQHKGDRLVHMYLFAGVDSQELHDSVNHQLTKPDFGQKVATQNGSNTGAVERRDNATLSSNPRRPAATVSTQPLSRGQDVAAIKAETPSLSMPSPLELPQPGHNMDVFVPVACHPGYFVVQRLEDLYKLTVMTEEMMLYYDHMEKSNAVVSVEKGAVYAAKIERSWHRVQVKGILTNGLVSVYELDHGKHELVRSTVIQPLISDFRQLPFQAIAAQLAGVKHGQWSEEASMLFRNNVENRALVAQVESVQEMPEDKDVPWERRLTVYLVDTSFEDEDLWIHRIMADVKL